MFDSVVRDQSSAPPVDLYGAGFPCQPFSSQGKKRGIEDPKSHLIFEGLEYIKIHHPKVVILEMVKGMLWPKHRPVFDHVVSEPRPQLLRISCPAIIKCRISEVQFPHLHSAP